jgi:SnoaL-like domain
MDDGPATLFGLAALNSDYAACIDADRLEVWPDFFVEACLYKITTAENHRRGYQAGVIYADSRAMLRDRVAALREANIYERQTYRHIVGMPRIDLEPVKAETDTAETRGIISAEVSAHPGFPAITGRLCNEFDARKMIIDSITGDSIQASGAPASRPQPIEPCREGRADPGAVSAA